MKNLHQTNNPFLNIAINISNTNVFDKSSFSLIEFLLDYEHFKNFDINESMLVDTNYQSNYGYQNENNIFLRNFFNIVFIMDNSFNPDLINKLVSIGMKIDPFLKDKSGNIESDILFSRPELDERRNIFLMNLYLNQNGIEDFTHQIKKFNTLHNLVSLNKLNVLEYLLKHVDINLTNNNLETCIMYVKNPDTLNFLAKYNPNWSQKDIFGKDASSFYSGHHNDEIKKILLDNFFKYLSSSSHYENNNDKDFIENRLKETLISLVEKDGTKSELQSFLKKYKIKNPHLIMNTNNRTLAHICIANGDFARSSIFEGTDYYHVDNNGYNIFNSLFRQSNIYASTKIDHAKKILLKCLEDKEKSFTEKSFNRLLNDFISSSNMTIPTWIIKDNTLRTKIFEILEVNYNEINIQEFLSNSNNSNQNCKNLFTLFKKLIKKYDIDLLKNNNLIEEFFNVRSYNSEHYFDKVNAENLKELLLVCDNVGKINLEEFIHENFKDINKFLLSLRETHSIYNKESYSSVELDNEIDKSFYSNVCSPFFKFLTENRLHKTIEILDEDLINKVIKNDTKGDLNDFLKTYSYLKINNKLSSSKKMKQIKI